MGRGRATIYATITSGDIIARADQATCSIRTEDPAQVRAESIYYLYKWWWRAVILGLNRLDGFGPVNFSSTTSSELSPPPQQNGLFYRFSQARGLLLTPTRTLTLESKWYLPIKFLKKSQQFFIRSVSLKRF